MSDYVEHPKLAVSQLFDAQKGWVVQNVASRCSILYDSYLHTLGECQTPEDLKNVLYGFEGSYEEIVSREMDMIEKYLKIPIRCRDPTCSAKMEYLPRHKMKLWDLNGTVTYTPDNYVVLEEEEYNRNMAVPVIQDTLNEILEQPNAFKEIDDFVEVQTKLQEIVLNQVNELKCTMKTVVDTLEKEGGQQPDLTNKLIANIDQFAESYKNAVRECLPTLEQNTKILLDEKKKLLEDESDLEERETPEKESSTDPERFRTLLSEIANTLPGPLLTVHPMLNDDRTIEYRIHVFNETAPFFTDKLYARSFTYNGQNRTVFSPVFPYPMPWCESPKDDQTPPCLLPNPPPERLLPKKQPCANHPKLPRPANAWPFFDSRTPTSCKIPTDTTTTDSHLMHSSHWSLYDNAGSQCSEHMHTYHSSEIEETSSSWLFPEYIDSLCSIRPNSSEETVRENQLSTSVGSSIPNQPCSPNELSSPTEPVTANQPSNSSQQRTSRALKINPRRKRQTPESIILKRYLTSKGNVVVFPRPNLRCERVPRSSSDAAAEYSDEANHEVIPTSS